ncbi:MAG: hypothetical protein PHW73_15055 [Atribacterota bacterium]|nr:hypothetical protein [Atribacterota bacterium]
MSRVRAMMPNVFIGHPFGGRFAVTKFRALFKELPFTVQYGNTNIQTKHLLAIMKEQISKSDFSIFDLSDWNSNVALELGLAEGLKRKPLKKYYILLNTRRSKNVPADIQGMQRIEYTSYDYRKDSGLGYQLIYYILYKEYLVKKIHAVFSGQEYVEKKVQLALKIMGYLRDHERLNQDNISTLARGLRLRKTHTDNVMKALEDLRVIKKAGGLSVYSKRLQIFKK